LIFLTTNRADDIDYAILSRCIAEIGYTTPGKTERKKLWQVLLKEFNVELSKDELDEVVECFPKVSGRDIQNLIRLTSRVCASVGAKFSVSTLKDNAVFRSIEILETNVNR
jgi:AAA+ superfamily predicted ATPase